MPISFCVQQVDLERSGCGELMFIKLSTGNKSRVPKKVRELSSNVPPVRNKMPIRQAICITSISGELHSFKSRLPVMKVKLPATNA